MPNFYIEKLIVTGFDKKPSILEFSRGLNIVRGPSDTGKSYIAECIDYIFGGKMIRLDDRTGYNMVRLEVKTEGGQVSLERKLNNNRISVSSTDKKITSGDYSVTTISDVWLSMIGILDEHKIIRNSNFKKQRLTWRTFLHMFFIKEDDVIQSDSIITSRYTTARTAALSALLFLITGDDLASLDELEDKRIKEAKKDAVIAFTNKWLDDFSTRRTELLTVDLSEDTNPEEQVEYFIGEIANTEERIATAVGRSKMLLKEIFTISEKMAECDTLNNRYQALKTQYAADIKRLTFIVEGDVNRDAIVPLTKCPICDHVISKQKDESYIEASHAELHRIQLQLNDLLDAEQALIGERAGLAEKLTILNAEKSGVEILLNQELKPKVVELRESLAAYRRQIEIKSEMKTLHAVGENIKYEMYETITEDETEAAYKPASYFTQNILVGLNKHLIRILESCRYEGADSAYLSPSSFDVVVGGKAKKLFGKGYRALLNTTLALAIMEYLVEAGKYAPGIFVVDSPILSLKEVGDEKAPDTMKAALFQYLMQNQNYGQLIILENNIPNLDYSGTNVITFTKDVHNGRYGFLNDVL